MEVQLNKINKITILIKRDIGVTDLKYAQKYLVELGTHYEYVDMRSMKLGTDKMDELVMMDVRNKYRRSIQYMYSSSILIINYDYSRMIIDNLINTWLGVLAEIRHIKKEIKLYDYIRLNNDTMFVFPPLYYNDPRLKHEPGNDKSQWSNIYRETANEMVMSQYQKNEELVKIIIVGKSIDHVNLYSMSGIIPIIIDREENKDVNELINEANKDKDNIRETEWNNGVNVGTEFDGTLKLRSIMSLVLNRIKGRYRKLVIIGSYPGVDFMGMWADDINRRYGIEITRIDPRGSEDVEFKRYYDWRSKDVGQGMFDNDTDTFVYDDSFLEDEKTIQVGIKMHHLSGFRGGFLLKSKKSWNSLSLTFDEMEIIYTPYVRKEFRILCEKTDEVRGVKRDVKRMDAIEYMQRKFSKIKLSLQKKIFINYFKIENVDMLDFRNYMRGDIVDAIFSLNGVDVNKLSRLVKSNELHIIFTQPYSETVSSVAYGDNLVDKTYELEFDNKTGIFAVPMTTIVRLAKTAVKYEFISGNLAQSSWMFTNIFNKYIAYTLTQPLQAKSEQIIDRINRKRFNEYYIRNKTIIDRYECYALNKEAHLEVKDTKELKLEELSKLMGNEVIIQIEQGQKVDISGHLTSIINCCMRFQTFLTFKAWIKIMRMYETSPLYHKEVLIRGKDLEGRIDAIGKPFHTKNDVLLSFELILLMTKGEMHDETSEKEKMKMIVGKCYKAYIEEQEIKYCWPK